MGLLYRLKAMGCRSDHLDLLVQDQKMQAANKINSSGIEAQIGYFLKVMTEEELVQSVEHEFKILGKYNMRFQSKLPAGNVKAKERKYVKRG